jgi:hypothetical protein
MYVATVGPRSSHFVVVFITILFRRVSPHVVVIAAIFGFSI